ncbi:hypothetical protein C6569_13440 [Phreatobacter cathodiphilus]|uniref:TVP38/TMEM64 family membrane protein n=2 Tax=Phreatobacter cathodiphilus TaxID=1868589 RepID=A0A2S0NCS6_9HYPH|nr:hypothetical protein C6569_13440 [Phreatobacter cathodiphilus]
MIESQDVATRPQAMSASSPLRWLRIGALLGGYGLILVLGHFAGRWLQQHLGFDPMNLQDPTAQTVLVVGLVLFVVMLAVPFVPGIEVSLALFAIFGAAVAMPVYVATVAALVLSYAAGRCVPLDRLAAFFDYVGLRPASEMVRRLGAMTPQQRVGALAEIAPNRIARLLVDHRDLTLVAALNMPGNALIGGGGGIALVAGMSGMFRPDRYLLAVAIAALPIPLLMVAGGQFLK